MDYFDSNFKNDQADQDSELPEGFSWEEMSGGIYDKMPNNRPSSLGKYWPLLILLLVAGCGTGSWFALNNFNGKSSTKHSIALDQKINTETTASGLNKIKTNEIAHNQADQIIESNLIPTNSLNSKNQIVKNNSSNTNSVRSNTLNRSNPTINNNKIEGQIFDKTESNISQLEQTTIAKQRQQAISESTKNETPVSQKEWSRLLIMPSLVYEASEDETAQYKIIDELKKPKVNREEKKDEEETLFKKQLTIGLAGGIVTWSAFDASNINHEHVSGYPGYTINPSIGLSFAPKHSIQFDYEYSAVEELFDYEGSREIEVAKDNEPFRIIHSSLTGNIISTERKNIVVPGTRNYKEVKYNQYKFHTLSLGYRFDQIRKQKLSLGFYVGASYLLKINSKGKRLNESLDVYSFDNSNPIFKNNQLALRLGLHYNYQLNENISLFSQIITTKYLSNWEVDSSGSTTRPFLYGVQLGFRYGLMK